MILDDYQTRKTIHFDEDSLFELVFATGQKELQSAREEGSMVNRMSKAMKNKINTAGKAESLPE